MLLDKTRTLKIADFGVARMEASNPNDMTGETGTLGYMAPEVYTWFPFNWTPRQTNFFFFFFCKSFFLVCMVAVLLGGFYHSSHCSGIYLCGSWKLGVLLVKSNKDVHAAFLSGFLLLAWTGFYLFPLSMPHRLLFNNCYLWSSQHLIIILVYDIFTFFAVLRRNEKHRFCLKFWMGLKMMVSFAISWCFHFSLLILVLHKWCFGYSLSF